MKNQLRSDIKYRIDTKAGIKLRERAIVWDIISSIPAVSDFVAVLSWLDLRIQFRRYEVTYRLISPKDPGKSIFLFVLELIPIASIYWGITKRVEGAIQESREEDEKSAGRKRRENIKKRRMYEERYKLGEELSDTQEETAEQLKSTARSNWDNRNTLYRK